MTRQELVDALTVERFTYYQRTDTRSAEGPDWWTAYDRVAVAEAVAAIEASEYEEV